MSRSWGQSGRSSPFWAADSGSAVTVATSAFVTAGADAIGNEVGPEGGERVGGGTDDRLLFAVHERAHLLDAGLQLLYAGHVLIAHKGMLGGRPAFGRPRRSRLA